LRPVTPSSARMDHPAQTKTPAVKLLQAVMDAASINTVSVAPTKYTAVVMVTHATYQSSHVIMVSCQNRGAPPKCPSLPFTLLLPVPMDLPVQTAARAVSFHLVDTVAARILRLSAVLTKSTAVLVVIHATYCSKNVIVARCPCHGVPRSSHQLLSLSAMSSAMICHHVRMVVPAVS
jgi:hypothetical protein